MSASNALETALLALLFTNTDLEDIGDAGGLQGSSTAGVYWIGLHTGDPGEGGSQNTSEASYTGYARVSVARSGAGWTVSGNAASNAAVIDFPEATGGSATCTHFSIGTDAAGAGTLLFSGALTTPLSVSTGITPSFAIGALTVTAD